MNEIDILETIVGGLKIRDMTTMTFLQFVARKLNDVKAYKASTVELTALLSSPPMSRKMPDEEKLKIIDKLRKLDVTI